MYLGVGMLNRYGLCMVACIGVMLGAGLFAGEPDLSEQESKRVALLRAGIAQAAACARPLAPVAEEKKRELPAIGESFSGDGLGSLHMPLARGDGHTVPVLMFLDDKCCDEAVANSLIKVLVQKIDVPIIVSAKVLQALFDLDVDDGPLFNLYKKWNQKAYCFFAVFPDRVKDRSKMQWRDVEFYVLLPRVHGEHSVECGSVYGISKYRLRPIEKFDVFREELDACTLGLTVDWRDSLRALSTYMVKDNKKTSIQWMIYAFGHARQRSRLLGMDFNEFQEFLQETRSRLTVRMFALATCFAGGSTLQLALSGMKPLPFPLVSLGVQDGSVSSQVCDAVNFAGMVQRGRYAYSDLFPMQKSYAKVWSNYPKVVHAGQRKSRIILPHTSIGRIMALSRAKDQEPLVLDCARSGLNEKVLYVALQTPYIPFPLCVVERDGLCVVLVRNLDNHSEKSVYCINALEVNVQCKKDKAVVFRCLDVFKNGSSTAEGKVIIARLNVVGNGPQRTLYKVTIDEHKATKCMQISYIENNRLHVVDYSGSPLDDHTEIIRNKYEEEWDALYSKQREDFLKSQEVFVGSALKSVIHKRQNVQRVSELEPEDIFQSAAHLFA